MAAATTAPITVPIRRVLRVRSRSVLIQVIQAMAADTVPT